MFTFRLIQGKLYRARVHLLNGKVPRYYRNDGGRRLRLHAACSIQALSVAVCPV